MKADKVHLTKEKKTYLATPVRQGDGARCEVRARLGSQCSARPREAGSEASPRENVAFLTMPDLVGRLSKSWLSGAMYGVMSRLRSIGT
jgi:hypothetical protein